MIYFTSYDILRATSAFFFLGCVFGILYGSFIYIFDFTKKLILLPKIAHMKYKKMRVLTKKTEQNSNGVSRQLIDFLFVFIFGLIFILFLYLFLDGEIRIFSFIFAFLGYAISYKILGVFFSTIINRFLSFLFKQIEFLFFILLYPIFSVLSLIKKLISPIIFLIIKKLKFFRFERLKRIKILQIKKIYEK